MFFLRGDSVYQKCPNYSMGRPRDVMVNVLNCEIVVSEFELQPSDLYPFKKYKPPYIPLQLWVSSTTVLLLGRI